MTADASPISSESCLGILAGNGSYPRILAERLYKQHIPFVVAGLQGQTAQTHFPYAVAYADFAVGAFRSAANFFITHLARSIFFSGGIRRAGVYRHLRPDPIGARLILSALLEGDDRFLKRCAAAFLKLGITVLDPTPLLSDLFVAPGRLAGPTAPARVLADLGSARHAALRLGAKDRGQAAVALNGNILGLEGRGGTDALILSKGRPGAVLVKMVKPHQDRRFDLPAVGNQTIAAAHHVGISAIGLESHGVLLLERDEVIAASNRCGISLYGLPPTGPSEA